MPLRVPFGLRDGLLYEPRQVSNGKACGCICPGCQHPLVAKQNAQTPHFAHAPGEDCNNGTETAIHLAAKQLIAERMEVSIPAVVLHLSGGYGVKESTQLLYTSKLKSLSEVRIEPWFDGFRPDIVVMESSINSDSLIEATNNSKEILIEIAVTHFVDKSKLAQIVERNLYAIEIDVSAAHGKMDFAMLQKFLFEVPSHAKWLHHPQAAKYEQEYIEKRKQDWEARQKVESDSFEKYQPLNPHEKIKEPDRFEKYRMLKPHEKIKRNIAKAGISQEQLEVLTVFIAEENVFTGGRDVWQSAVLAYISNRIEEERIDDSIFSVWLNAEVLEDWLSKLFRINRPFPDAEKIALWKYLKHLETLGLVRGCQNKFFDILTRPKDYLP